MLTKKQSTQCIFLIFALALTQTSSVLALDFLGPPVAQLDKGKLSAGAEFSTGKFEFKAKGFATWYDWGSMTFPYRSHVHNIHMKNIKTQKTYGTVGYGLTDSWDVSVSLGTVKSSWNYYQENVGSSWNYNRKSESSRDNALSIGIRRTLYSKGKLKIGALAKYSRLRMDEANFHTEAANRTVEMSAELAMDEFQIAVGASYDMSKNLCIYGGPFIHWMDGELNDVIVPLQPGLGDYIAYGSYDLLHAEEIGGYIGVQARLRKNTTFNIEYQRTNSADCLGMSLLFRCK